MIPDFVKIRTYIVGLIASASKESGQQRLPSERELCKVFQTSRTTLRKALKQLADEGYLQIKPNLGIFINEEYQSMVDFYSKLHKFVGIIVIGGETTFFTPFLLRVLSSVMEGLGRQGHCGRMLTVYGDPQQELDFLLQSHQLDGMIFINPTEDLLKCREIFMKNNIPLVVGMSCAYEEVGYCVYSDPYDSEYLITKYLIEQGHKDILYIESRPPDSAYYTRRKEGAKAAFAEAGFEWNEKLWHYEVAINAREKVANICKYGPEFTAASVTESFYMPITEHFVHKPDMPIIYISGNFDPESNKFQIMPDCNKMGREMANIMDRVIREPSDSITTIHKKIGFKVKK